MSITLRELATLLAALQFWRDEITQSGDFSARPYLRMVGHKDVEPLNTAEIDELSAKVRNLLRAEA